MKNQIKILLSCMALMCFAMGFSPNAEREFSSPNGGAYLTFAGKFGGELTTKDLKKYKKVEVSGCAKGSKIFKFTLHIVKKGKHKTHRTQSSNLTATMLRDLQTLTKGDKFYFKNVEAHLPNGKDKVDVHTRTFTII